MAKYCCPQGWDFLIHSPCLGRDLLNCTADMLEKPSVKTQIFDFFERCHIYLAVASSWCHCSFNKGYLHALSTLRTPPIPQTRVRLFHLNKSEDLSRASLLSLNICDTGENIPTARMLLMEQEHGLDLSSESAAFITSCLSTEHLIWQHC